MEQKNKFIEDLKAEEAWNKTFVLIKDVAIKQAKRRENERLAKEAQKQEEEKAITFISKPE